MARGSKVKAIEEYRDRIKQQIADLTIELRGVENALRAASGEIDKETARKPRSNVKQIILQLLQEVGETGLNANTAVEIASRRNERLERPTVSSLLSRFKAEGLVSYDGNVYRLVKQTTSQAAEGGQAMH